MNLVGFVLNQGGLGHWPLSGELIFMGGALVMVRHSMVRYFLLNEHVQIFSYASMGTNKHCDTGVCKRALLRNWFVKPVILETEALTRAIFPEFLSYITGLRTSFSINMFNNCHI